MHTNGTIATGGAVQEAKPARPRQAIFIQTFDGDLWVKFGGTAAVNSGLKVTTTQPLRLLHRDFPVIASAVSIFGATTGWNYAILES